MDYDVIIAGAGPAGSVLGRELARQGLAVLMLEKEKLPRLKPCGGGITARARRLFAGDLEELVEDRVTGLTITYKYGEPLEIATPEPLIFTVMRERLDLHLASLAREAGAEIREGLPLSGVVEEEDGLRVLAGGKILRARVLAGADGARSRVAALLYPPQRRLGIALEAEVEVSPPMQEAFRSKALLNHGSIREGYDWIFPKKHHLSLGSGTFAEKSHYLKAHYLKTEERLLKEQVKKRSWRGHLLPTLKEVEPRFHSSRTILLGDAAGLVDPLTGEGIYGAVKSALLAAEVLPRALSDRQPDLSPYTEQLKKELLPELQAAGQLARAVYLAPRLFFQIVKKNQELLYRLARVIAGQESYTDLVTALRRRYFFLRPLLKTSRLNQ